MLIALMLADTILADAGAIREPFDLAQLPAVLPVDHAATARARYLTQLPQLHEDARGDGIRVKLHGKRVKLTVPIPSI